MEVEIESVNVLVTFKDGSQREDRITNIARSDFVFAEPMDHSDFFRPQHKYVYRLSLESRSFNALLGSPGVFLVRQRVIKPT